MKIVILTGVSGSGKSTAIKYFEDSGYYCVDNMPPYLLESFLNMPARINDILEKICFVIDIRGRKLFADFIPILERLEKKGIRYDILYLEADNKTIVKRYKETRRAHPISGTENLLESIKKEKEILKEIKEKASVIINTTDTSVKDLKEKIGSYFNEEIDTRELVINIISFGFKHGLPIESDLVFDVRFMNNPYYIEKYRNQTGLDKEVREYVIKKDAAKKFIDKLEDMLDFLIPNYIAEGKSQLVISIGCTGGHHRSVAISEKISNYLKDKELNVFIQHRDIEK